LVEVTYHSSTMWVSVAAGVMGNTPERENTLDEMLALRFWLEIATPFALCVSWIETALNL